MSDIHYKVRFYEDHDYEVYSYNDDTEKYEFHYKGSLADCGAWIRLTEGEKL